jgi:hypothetical protein
LGGEPAPALLQNVRALLLGVRGLPPQAGRGRRQVF